MDEPGPVRRGIDAFGNLVDQEPHLKQASLALA